MQIIYSKQEAFKTAFLKPGSLYKDIVFITLLYTKTKFQQELATGMCFIFKEHFILNASLT